MINFKFLNFMKKLFVVLGITAFCLGVISCKKECVCTIKTPQGTYKESYKTDKQECKKAIKENDKDFKCAWR